MVCSRPVYLSQLLVTLWESQRWKIFCLMQNLDGTRLLFIWRQHFIFLEEGLQVQLMPWRSWNVSEMSETCCSELHCPAFVIFIAELEKFYPALPLSSENLKLYHCLSWLSILKYICQLEHPIGSPWLDSFWIKHICTIYPRTFFEDIVGPFSSTVVLSSFLWCIKP